MGDDYPRLPRSGDHPAVLEHVPDHGKPRLEATAACAQRSAEVSGNQRGSVRTRLDRRAPAARTGHPPRASRYDPSSRARRQHSKWLNVAGTPGGEHHDRGHADSPPSSHDAPCAGSAFRPSPWSQWRHAQLVPAWSQRLASQFRLASRPEPDRLMRGANDPFERDPRGRLDACARKRPPSRDPREPLNACARKRPDGAAQMGCPVLPTPRDGATARLRRCRPSTTPSSCEANLATRMRLGYAYVARRRSCLARATTRPVQSA